MPVNRYCLGKLSWGLASVGAVLGVSALQSTRKLPQADVDHYIGILEGETSPQVEDRDEFMRFDVCCDKSRRFSVNNLLTLTGMMPAAGFDA
jgi:hypothetical protein